MKTRTALRAGKAGNCSPEAAHYMEKALNMAAKIENCVVNKPSYTGYYQPQPYYGNVQPYYPTYPTNPTIPSSNVGNTYPDRSGWCG